jgi:hypothetical protein
MIEETQGYLLAGVAIIPKIVWKYAGEYYFVI